jgi:hypothetical protein
MALGRVPLLYSTQNSGACVDHRDFPSDRIVELATTATGDMWLAHHSPRATTDTDPPDPDYFSIWSLLLPKTQHGVVRPELQFVRRSALSHAGERLALIHGAPPVHLSIANAGTGKISARQKSRSVVLVVR